MSTDDTRPDLSVPLDERAAAPAPPAGEVYARHLAAAAEAADTAYRLAAARVVVYEFLHQYGRSDLPAFRVALDLASSLRKVIDDLGDEEAITGTGEEPLSAVCTGPGCGEQFADSESGEYLFATRGRMERLLYADGWAADPVLCPACQQEAGHDPLA